MFHNNLIIIIHNNDLANFHYLQRVRMIYLDKTNLQSVSRFHGDTLSDKVSDKAL